MKTGTKIYNVYRYFDNNNKLISIKLLITRFNISESYCYTILKKLIDTGKIVKVQGKIIYFIKKI